MPIRLVAVDLDKTLLHSDKSLSAFSAQTLCACRDAGIRVVLATARTEVYCEDIVRAVCPDAVISCSGALARAGKTVLFDRPISPEESDALVSAVLHCPSYRRMTVQTAENHFTSYSNNNGFSTPYDFTRPLHVPAYKITPELGDPADADRLRVLFPGCEAVRFTGENWYRFVAKGCGKWPALLSVAAHFDISPAEIAAFGDDVLDDEMLSRSGYGVAMANAASSTAAAAKYHCESNDDDGVARWLRRTLPHLFTTL